MNPRNSKTTSTSKTQKHCRIPGKKIKSIPAISKGKRTP